VDHEDATDALLLQSIARGDRAAFNEFYRRMAPWLLVRLRRRCRDEDLIADTLQETFVTIWRTSSGYTGAGSLAG
jgi:RNA polymerase sigma-70 factor (ECF subfamily)